jgi:hypothetical protein
MLCVREFVSFVSNAPKLASILVAADLRAVLLAWGGI